MHVISPMTRQEALQRIVELEELGTEMLLDVGRLRSALRVLWRECIIIGDQCGQAPGARLKAQCERALGEELSEDLPF